MCVAYNRWEEQNLPIVNKVVKGAIPGWSTKEVQAEVANEGNRTQLNGGPIALLERADRVYITGEAGNHCVKATTEHTVANFASDAKRYLNNRILKAQP